MNKPEPQVTALTEPYWQAAARGELHLQRCGDCGHWIHFPEFRCPSCGGRSLDYEAASGEGVVETFSVIHRSFVEGFAEAPYVIAWVALAEQPGLRVMCNILNCEPENVEIGMPVALCFEDRGNFGKIPQFAPTAHLQNQ